jgi:N6-adenosine-specific RNA methylase IME4
MTTAPSDHFRIVLADPPWPFRDALPGRGRGAAKHHACLSVAEICAFPLPPLAPDCALFLWQSAARWRSATEC